MIQELIALNDIAPTFDELRHELGFRSKSDIGRLVSGLARRRVIKFRRYTPRSIELLRRVPVPDSLAAEYSDAERAALGIACPAEVAS